MRARLLTGPSTLQRLSDGLHDLHTATACPVTARSPWLTAWQECHVQFEPVAVVVEDGGERLEAAALLVQERRAGVTRVLAMGHGASDQARLPARSPAAAEALAQGIEEFLDALAGPWRLVVRHLPQDDAVVTALLDRLRYAEAVHGDLSPVTRFGADRRIRTYVSRNHHQQVKRMRNRIRREGREVRVAHLKEAHEVAGVLDEVESLCRARDLSVRGWSLLEQRAGACFFRRVVLDHAQRAEVVLTTLRLDGELAAYVLCFRDGSSYRMWNCRVSPDWVRYGAGRLANDVALAHALADESSTEFDWMRGDESYKFSMATDVQRAQDLLAWSSPGMRTVADVPRRLKEALLGSARRHPVLGHSLPYVRQLHHTGRRVRSRLSGAR